MPLYSVTSAVFPGEEGVLRNLSQIDNLSHSLEKDLSYIMFLP